MSDPVLAEADRSEDAGPAGGPIVAACPFCAPAIAASVFLEDDRFRALYDIAPILPGHSLVIPRRHVGRVFELDDSELGGLAIFAGRVSRLLARAFPADGFDWAIQDGASAGQTVPHLHLHVIPRHSGDLPDPGDWYPRLVARDETLLDDRSRPRLPPPDMQRIVRHLRALAAADED